jgi:uncharacterized Fe-S cluster-containing radical SAM superfamily protein
MGWNEKAGQVNSLGNIKQESLTSVIAGPVMRELRQAIAQGDWHPFCARCKDIELQGRTSPRQTSLAEPATVAQIDQDQQVFRLTHLSVNWSNICNLTCTYCNPATSTAWQRVLRLPISHVRNEHADLIQLVKNNQGLLLGLSLGGGEPLLQPGLVDLLHEVDSERVSVMITTNLSIDLEHNATYQELRTWPNVQWMVSFDNANADKFEYVRRGAKWSQFVHNIRLLKQHGQRVTAHPAYSIYCAFDLVEYYEFCQAEDLCIFWCDLIHPEALDARGLSPLLRQRARDQIDCILTRWGTSDNRDSRWSLSTLSRYGNELLQDPATTVDPWSWHAVQEQARSHTTRFEDLWPKDQLILPGPQ